MSNYTSPDPRAAAAFWGEILDPRNLAKESDEEVRDIHAAIASAWTPDFRTAQAWLLPFAEQAPEFIVDLGAGVGNHALALAQTGQSVLALDASVLRLRRLRKRAATAGLRVTTVAAEAEALPFKSSSLRALYTKSVLIHTDLERATAEISRVLMPAGRATLAEPQTGNPFVRAYRRTLAPAAWRTITRYFDESAQHIVLQRIGRGTVRPFYFLGFMAFAFEFGLFWPRIRNLLLVFLGPLDQCLFRLFPPLHRWAWFGLIMAEKTAAASPEDQLDGDALTSKR